MKAMTLDQLLTPSEMDSAKQYWRSDVSTWREKFRPHLVHERLAGVDRDELLAALENYFSTLPNNVARR